MPQILIKMPRNMMCPYTGARHERQDGYVISIAPVRGKMLRVFP